MGLIGFILGTVLGSFVLALANRSLTKRSFWGRSYCEKCKKSLLWYDLFPILSYIILRGRCRWCKKKISLEYLVVEVVMGILIGFLFWQSTKNLQFSTFPIWERQASLIYNFQSIFNFKFSIFILDLLFKIFFITILASLFITDLKKMLIPDRISIPAIWVSLIYLVSITIFKIGYLYYYLSQDRIGKYLLPPHSDYFQRHALTTVQPLLGSIIMGLAIAGFFTLLIIITRGKGMGGGDVKLGGLIGLGLGFPLALVALMISFISGAITSLILVIFGRKNFGQSVPFGPFLVLGSLVALFWGNQIIDWYLKLGY